MQAAAQKWVDSSISKTINCPENISFENFKEVYLAAWDQGCKGCTTYRPNKVTGSVLSISNTESAETEIPKGDKRNSENGAVVYMSEPLARPQDLGGKTYKVKWPDSEHALYITINDILLNGNRRLRALRELYDDSNRTIEKYKYMEVVILPSGDASDGYGEGQLGRNRICAIKAQQLASRNPAFPVAPRHEPCAFNVVVYN